MPLLLRFSRSRKFFVAAALVLLALIPACKKTALTKHEYMYVSVPETSLRDRVATMYNKVGTVHNGERVEVLEKQRRFLRVRTDGGQEGWIEERSLVPQEVYDGFQKLAQEEHNQPTQAHGATRAELNMHLTPSRDGERLYQLKDGEKVDVLKRATAEKNPPKPAAAAAATASKTANPTSKQAPPAAGTPAKSPTPPASAPATSSAPGSSAAAGQTPVAPPKPPVMEDWYLVRDSSGHAGWVLLRMIDLDVPLEVAQYAEGQRIMGYFVLNTVPDEDRQVPQYLVLLNEPKDGLSWDFNQIRVFTWNRGRHRYETAYRERELQGYLPVETGHHVFGKEGDLPTFVIHKKNVNGQTVEITYKLNGPIVRRVLTPEQEAAEKANREAAYAARHKQSKSTAHTKHKHK